MELSRRTIQRMILRQGSETTVINQSGGEGGGGGSQPSTTLGPLLTSLNTEAMPSAEGYLHWSGTAWEWTTPAGGDPVDLTPYALKTWVQNNFATLNDISGLLTKAQADEYYAPISFVKPYLPLAAGGSYPLTGSLYINGSNNGIQWSGNKGMLCYKPASGWSGVTSTQWGVGSHDANGIIRSSSALERYDGTNNYTIYDSSNLDPLAYATKDQLSGYLPLTGGEVGDLTVNGTVIAEGFLTSELEELATEDWVEGQGYQTGAIESVSCGGSPLPVSNKSVSIPLAGVNTPGVIQVGEGLTNNESHLEVDTSVIASRSWASSAFLPLSGGALTGNLYWNVANEDNLLISHDSIQLLVGGMPQNVVLFEGSTGNQTSYAKFYERPMVKTGTENGAPVYTNVALVSEVNNLQAKIGVYNETGSTNAVYFSHIDAPGATVSSSVLTLPYLNLSGGTLKGNLRLKDNTNYGLKLLFGNGENCYLHEDADDHLKVYAKNGVTIEDEAGRILFITPPDYLYFTNSENSSEKWYYTGTSIVDYYKSLLIWLCEQYGTAYSGKNVMFVMKCQPNSLNMAMLTIYNPAIVDDETGLPQYAFGMAITLGNSQSFASFGSFSYAYYYNGGKVAEAAKLSTARTLWSQPFDGSGNISGDLAVTNAEVKVSNGNGGWVHQVVHTASGASESTYKFYVSQNAQNSTPVTGYEFDKDVKVKKLIADEVQADNINAGLDIIMDDVSVSGKTGRIYVDNGSLYYQYDNGTPVRIA